MGVLGDSSCEAVLVDHLGSLHLTAPLAHAHKAGEAVIVQQNTTHEPGLGETKPHAGQTKPNVDQMQPDVDQVL